MVELSWAGETTSTIAWEPRCGGKTVRRRLHRFNQSGPEGLEDLGGQGRESGLTTCLTSRSRSGEETCGVAVPDCVKGRVLRRGVSFRMEEPHVKAYAGGVL
ncbi:hypothetical protein GO002_24945 [Streptomyces eurocidicus]|nr:hypothetical protein [Streptomyces eurocidicus]